MRRSVLPVLLIVLLGALAGCRKGSASPPQATASPTPAPATQQATVPPQPTLTPTPSRSWLVLWAAENTSEDLLQRAMTVLQETGLPADWEPKVVRGEPLPTADEGVAAVLVLPPYGPNDVLPWAQANPGVPVLVMGSLPEEAQTPPRMILLDASGLRPTVLAFLTGYLSVVAAPDWRAAALLPQGQAQSPWARAFVQGGWYYCGLCKPPKPPFVRYPVVLPVAGNEPGTWEAVCTQGLATYFLQVAYLPDEAPREAAACLKAQEVLILRGGPLQPEDDAALYAPDWETLLRMYVRRLWEGPYGPVAIKPRWESRQDTVFTPGRMQMLWDLWEQIQSGYVTVPEE